MVNLLRENRVATWRGWGKDAPNTRVVKYKFLETYISSCRPRIINKFAYEITKRQTYIKLHYLVNEYCALNSEINANKNWIKSCHKYKMADCTVTKLQGENEEKTSHAKLPATSINSPPHHLHVITCHRAVTRAGTVF